MFHRSLQGTSTAQHVRVVLNTAGIDAFKLQILLYHLAYAYPKASCAVRQPVLLRFVKEIANRLQRTQNAGRSADEIDRLKLVGSLSGADGRSMLLIM